MFCLSLHFPTLATWGMSRERQRERERVQSGGQLGAVEGSGISTLSECNVN